MTAALIVEQAAFEELCDHIRASGIVAFDTEFVSEYTYRPELCLLQLATPERQVAVDPYRVDDLSSWWAIVADPQTTVVAHAGREEVRFCLTHSGQRPQRFADTQIAEGLRSRSYPIGYESLAMRVLGKRLRGDQTRTDWRRRPLSDRQIEYAIDDVKYVLEIWRRQRQSLERLQRLAWAEAEFERMIDDVAGEKTNENWRRLSGVHRLNERELAVAREMYRWREQEAAERDVPMRRILRDDLVLDLAKRQPETAGDVLATRDMNRPGFKQHVSKLIECIRNGLAVPKDQLPCRIANPGANHDEHVLGKLLAIALTNRCAELDVSMTLVSTMADLKDLVRWHGSDDSPTPRPRLAQGWRANVCGDLLKDLLDGKISLRVADPNSDHPLVFERRAGDELPRS